VAAPVDKLIPQLQAWSRTAHGPQAQVAHIRSLGGHSGVVAARGSDPKPGTSPGAGKPMPNGMPWPVWLETYSRYLQPCQSRLLARTFKGSIRAKQVSDITCVEIASTPQRILHDKVRTPLGAEAFCVVRLQLEGGAVVAQAGREAVLEPSDLVVCSSCRPSEVLFTRSSKQLLVKVPYGHERPRLGDAELSYGAKVEGKSGAGAPISRFLQALWANIDLVSVATYPIFQVNISNLTELLLALTHSEESRPTVRHTHLRRILEHIEANLADPGLNPADIARRQGFTLRYLHKIFDVTGQTVSKYIRQRRLKRCWEDLIDPTSQHLQIGQLAMRWGFTDAAHFSHVFRNRYGQSPREFRNLMKARGDDGDFVGGRSP
jgi:AraC-like DNA-binding protein